MLLLLLLLLSPPLLLPLPWLHATFPFQPSFCFYIQIHSIPTVQARSNSAAATALHSCAVKCAAVNKMRPLDFAKAAASAAKAMVSAELCRTLLEEMGKDAAQLPTLSLQHLQR